MASKKQALGMEEVQRNFYKTPIVYAKNKAKEEQNQCMQKVVYACILGHCWEDITTNLNDMKGDLLRRKASTEFTKSKETIKILYAAIDCKSDDVSCVDELYKIFCEKKDNKDFTPFCGVGQ